MTVSSKMYELVIVVPAPMVQFCPITEAMRVAFSETFVDEPIRVLVPILQVLRKNKADILRTGRTNGNMMG